MNIELDEVVPQDVSDDALELAAGGALVRPSFNFRFRLLGIELMQSTNKRRR